MQSRRINFNVEKTAFPALGMNDVHGDMLCCCSVCSHLICLVNAELTRVPLLPPSALFTLSDTLHNTVSAVMTMLYFSRPRGLRLARSVSSRAVFVGVGVFWGINLVQRALRGHQNCPLLETSVQFLHLVYEERKMLTTGTLTP